MPNPDPDRDTRINADQIADGTITPRELATTNEALDQDPSSDEVLHGLDMTGEDRKLKFKRVEALNVDTDTTNFNGALSANETDVQKALDRLDDIVGVFVDNIKTMFFLPNTNASSTIANYSVATIGANSDINLTFKIPPDFNELVALELFFIPVNTLAAGNTIDLDSNYAMPGEILTQNSETSEDLSISGTADIIESYDISIIFTSLEAGHICGLKWKNNSIGTQLAVLGIRLKYT